MVDTHDDEELGPRFAQYAYEQQTQPQPQPLSAANASAVSTNDVWLEESVAANNKLVLLKTEPISSKAVKLAIKERDGIGNLISNPEAEAAEEEEEEEEERKGLADILMDFCRLVIAIIFFLLKCAAFMPMLWSSLWAILCIAVVVGIFGVICYLVFVSNPRMPLIWHSQDHDSYMASYIKDLLESLNTLKSSHVTALNGVSKVTGDQGASCNRIYVLVNMLLGRDTLDADLVTYFQFHDQIQSMGFLAQRDLRANAPDFVNDDDEVDVSLFKSEVVDPLDYLFNTVSGMSDSLAKQGSLLMRPYDVLYQQSEPDQYGDITLKFNVFLARISGDEASTKNPAYRKNVVQSSNGSLKAPTYETLNGTPISKPPSNSEVDPLVVKYVTAVHKIRMMADQRKDIGVMYQSRRKNLPMGIWTIYYAPLMVSLFFSFLTFWKKFPKSWVRRFLGTIEWWMGLGPSIASLPCKMAYTDPIERSDKCRETLVSNFGTFQNPGEDISSTDVIEHFFDLGGIVRALSSVGAFFTNMASIGLALADLLMKFPIDPFNSIIRLISIILGIIIGLFMMIWWVLLTVMLFPLVLAFAWANITLILGGILYTLWLIILALLLAIPYFGLWIIDMPTNGFVVRSMHCENSPGRWHSQNGEQDDNSYIRYFPFCMSPCASRYSKSWSGCCCDKLPDFMPSMCPQQYIYNLAMDNTNTSSMFSGPVAFDKYKGSSAFQKMSVQAKRKFLIDAFKSKVSLYQKCYDTESISSKDYLTRHLCNVFDKLGLDDATRNKLAVVCSECYCKYEPDSGGMTYGLARMTATNSQQWAGNDSLCRELQGNLDSADDIDSSNPGGQLLRKTLLFALIVMASMAALYTMTRSGHKLIH